MLYFDEANVELVRDFQKHKIEQQENHVNTIHSNMEVLRDIIREAIAEDLMPASQSTVKVQRIK